MPVNHSTAVHPAHPSRVFLLRMLAEANPRYDEAVAAGATAFPQSKKWFAGVSAARHVRLLLWDQLAVTDTDETIWLTPSGWAAVAALPEMAEAST
jgi:hypothetical protein